MPIVKSHIERCLGRPLKTIPERSGVGPTHDLETNDGRAPSIAVEVKEIVPSEFLATQARVNRDKGLDSTILTKRWSVALMEDGLGSRLAPMPRFPDDPSAAEVANMALYGLRPASTKAERESRWKIAQTLAPRPAVSVKNLTVDIEPHLAILERLGINTTRRPEQPDELPQDRQAANSAIWAIRHRTGGAICMGRPLIGDEAPGIDLVFGYGQVRTSRPDVVVERVQLWLDSDQSINLIESLRASNADERHGALWLSTEPESQTAIEQGLNFCPTRSLDLPIGVDELWILCGPISWRFDGSWAVDWLSGGESVHSPG